MHRVTDEMRLINHTILEPALRRAAMKMVKNCPQVFEGSRLPNADPVADGVASLRNKIRNQSGYLRNPRMMESIANVVKIRL